MRGYPRMIKLLLGERIRAANVGIRPALSA